MIKKSLVVIVLLFLVAPIKGTYSQSYDQPDPQQLEAFSWEAMSEPAKAPPTSESAVLGQSVYYTHPEFTNIMTTTVTTAAQNTADGYIFVASLAQFYNGPASIMLLDNAGEPVYIKPIPNDPFVGDFKKQTVDGTDYLTYHAGIQPGGFTHGTSYVLDENYQVVDTWTIDNGLGADTHDFLLLNNGHAIQLAYVPTPFDFTPYGGPPNGTLIDIIIQEQDADKNVVFEWVASEHLPIEDTEANLNTTNPVDFLHTNGIAVDNDGNLLLSHRHFSEITKISRQTGDIIWRMGGAGNEFTFTNDIGFSNQHNINRLENGNITLFDNGNQHTPSHSRAVEYAIDETAKTVTRVWMYPDDTSEFSSAMGNFQLLANGNSMIGWGSQPKLTEVQNDGTVALEMLLGTLSYRAFRFPWSGTPDEAPRTALQYGTDPTAATVYTSWNGATEITGYDVYAGPTTSTLALVTNAPRSGFETEIPLSGLPADTCFFQTKPIHAQGDSTPFSNITFRVDIPVCWDHLNHSYMPLTAK